MKEDLGQKLIFNVSQNDRWNEKKYARKILQNVLKKQVHFLAQNVPL
jgi:hypothetical protein